MDCRKTDDPPSTPFPTAVLAVFCLPTGLWPANTQILIYYIWNDSHRKHNCGHVCNCLHCITKWISNVRGFTFLAGHRWKLKSLLILLPAWCKKNLVHMCLYLVPAALPICLWCYVRIQGSWVCAVGMFLKAGTARASDCKPCILVSSSLSQMCLYRSLARPSYSIHCTGTNNHP